MIPDQVGMARIGLQQSIDLCRDTSRILNTEAPRRLRRSGSRRARNGREVRRIEPETGGIGVHQLAHALVSESVPRAPQQVRLAHAIRAACVEVFFWVPIGHRRSIPRDAVIIAHFTRHGRQLIAGIGYSGPPLSKPKKCSASDTSTQFVATPSKQPLSPPATRLSERN
jgi:hypothetical protein